MQNFYELNEQQCEVVNGGGILSGAAGGILGFMVGSVASVVKIAVTGSDKGTAQIILTTTTAGAWAGAGFPAP